MISPSPTVQQIVQQIRPLIEPFLEEQDQWHGLFHVVRVVEFARLINKDEGADPFLVEVGAWLHQFHDPNLDKLRPILDSLRIPQLQKGGLYEIVEHCRPNRISSKSSLEARVVFDADAGDLAGPAGIIREIACNYGDRSKPPSAAIADALSVQRLFVEKLQTEGGKRLYAERNGAANSFWEALERDEASLSESVRLFPVAS